MAVARDTKGKNKKYLDQIQTAEKKAKEQKQNIWSIENYAQAGKGYSQAVVDAHKKALKEAEAAKKAEAERLKKEQEAKAAEEKRAAEQAEADRKAEEKRAAEQAEAARKAEEARVAQEAAAQQAAAAQAQAEAEAQQQAAAEPAQGQTVYVTPTGSKYHTHKCGNGTYTPATLEEAQARGLEPCSKCF